MKKNKEDKILNIILLIGISIMLGLTFFTGIQDIIIRHKTIMIQGNCIKINKEYYCNTGRDK